MIVSTFIATSQNEAGIPQLAFAYKYQEVLPQNEMILNSFYFLGSYDYVSHMNQKDEITMINNSSPTLLIVTGREGKSCVTFPQDIGYSVEWLFEIKENPTIFYDDEGKPFYEITCLRQDTDDYAKILVWLDKSYCVLYLFEKTPDVMNCHKYIFSDFPIKR